MASKKKGDGEKGFTQKAKSTKNVPENGVEKKPMGPPGVNPEHKNGVGAGGGFTGRDLGRGKIYNRRKGAEVGKGSKKNLFKQRKRIGK